MIYVATIDWETASQCDLSDAGSYAYWEHPTTEVLCVCVIVRLLGIETERFAWIPGLGDTPENARALGRLRALAHDPNVVFEAHKADFEQAGWAVCLVRKLGFPEMPPERWDDTMARCYYRGVPGGLDKAAVALEVSEQKDAEGRALTLSLSKPITKKLWMTWKPDGITQAEWNRQYRSDHYDRRPEILRRVADYCMQDCVTEIAVGDAVGPLSHYERRVWELDQRMNQRGLAVDLNYIRASKAVIDVAKRPLLAEFDKLTGGLSPTQNAKLLGWCRGQGLEIDSLAKDKLKAIGIKGLDEDEDEPDEYDAENQHDEAQRALATPMPYSVRRALTIRAVLASSSISKLDRILVCVCHDGRVRYTIQYHGAGTGRWAGRLFQPQNFPRGKIEGGHSPDALVRAIMLADHNPAAAADLIALSYGDPIAAVASGLRHAIIAGPDNEFETGDFAGIEARVVLALAGQHDKCELMASGFDVYLDMAEDIYNQPKGSWALEPTPENEKRQKAIKEAHVPQRTIGKNTILGCGFGMGWWTYQQRYCPDQPEEFARRCINTYRKEWAPLVPKLWYALEEAALKAVFDKGEATAYGITYRWFPGWLACLLPDGQIMWYRNPHLVHRPMPWDKDDIRLGWAYHAQKNGHWRRIYAYGGLLAENAVQKIARGFLVEAMFRLEEEGHPLVLTVHDECMSEVSSLVSNRKVYEQIMAQPTRYSREIRVPISVEGWIGPRYKK